jgi:ATP-binding cassette subfamily B protein
MTEARIQRALEMLLRGRTSFVVAHRLSTIRHADLVLVLDHGKIVEQGTHTQLLAANGTYAELYRQFVRS